MDTQPLEHRLAPMEVALRYEHLVKKIAKDFYPRRSPAFDWEDFLQEGFLGLTRAAELHDHRRPDFMQHASNWIRHSIQKGIKDKARLVRIPIYLYRNKPPKQRGIWNVEETFWRNKKLAQLIFDAAFLVPEFAKEVPLPITQALSDDLEETKFVLSKVKRLPRLHRKTLVHSYGLFGHPPKTRPQLVSLLGVSIGRISTLRREALEILVSRLPQSFF